MQTEKLSYSKLALTVLLILGFAAAVILNQASLVSAAPASFVQNGNSFGVLAVLGTNDNFGLAFETNNTERMRLDTTGRLGLGLTSPAATLHVLSGNPFVPHLLVESNSISANADLQLKAQSTWQVYTAPIASLESGAFLVEDRTSAPDFPRLKIDSQGNVGINTPPGGAVFDKLHVDGNIRTRDGDVNVVTQGKGVVLRATDGANCYRVTVNNAGTLSTTLVTCP